MAACVGRFDRAGQEYLSQQARNAFHVEPGEFLYPLELRGGLCQCFVFGQLGRHVGMQQLEYRRDNIHVAQNEQVQLLFLVFGVALGADGFHQRIQLRGFVGVQVAQGVASIHEIGLLPLGGGVQRKRKGFYKSGGCQKVFLGAVHGRQVLLQAGPQAGSGLFEGGGIVVSHGEISLRWAAKVRDAAMKLNKQEISFYSVCIIAR